MENYTVNSLMDNIMRAMSDYYTTKKSRLDCGEMIRRAVSMAAGSPLATESIRSRNMKLTRRPQR